MIESKVKEKRLTELVERWVLHTKVSPYLRDYDISNLVSRILSEFYRITLSCRHQVMNLDEGIELAFKERDGSTIYGSFCRDCAETYKKDLEACEVKDDNN